MQSAFFSRVIIWQDIIADIHIYGYNNTIQYR